MEKLKFKHEDESRLAELVNIYLGINGKFRVTGDGGIVIKKEGIFGWILGEREDFLSLVISIINKLIEKKGGINYVEVLCSDALGAIVTNNDRIEAVKKLYTAHLIDADPKFHKEQKKIAPREFDVEIKVEPQNANERVVRVGRSLELSETIAEMLNKNKYIIVRD